MTDVVAPSSVARAVAAVNVAAIERNCARLASELHGGARLCAVVKADGYGHGAAAAARAALAGGASCLAVATAGEAAALRAAGLEARLLVLGALTRSDLQSAIAARAEVVAWTQELVSAAAALGGARVHIKLDTGMGRLGARDLASADRLADIVAATPALQLAGAMTHFATADERGDAYFAHQLGRFTAWVRALRERHPGVAAHAANSAATLRDPASHFDMVRCGIALYGLDPFGEDPRARRLEPALELCSYVAQIKPLRRGESAGYGRRFVARTDTAIAVLPIGYGDGWRRALSDNADVLIGGRRYPLVGTVSMDNITVDLQPDGRGVDVAVGATAVLIGRDGDHRVTAEEVAARISTINYEVTCGLGQRVTRRHHRDGDPAAA